MVRRLLVAIPNISVVGIESPAYEAGPFQTIHHTLLQFSMVSIFEKRIDCVLFDPATLKYLVKEDSSKKRGIIQKLDVQRYVQKNTNDPTLIDNNEADAYCIGYFTTRFMDLKNGKLKPSDLTKSEYDVFLGRHKKIQSPLGKSIKRTAHIFRENSRYFAFSKIPLGSKSLAKKSLVDSQLIKLIETKEMKR
jgi:hypothetical protein